MKWRYQFLLGFFLSVLAALVLTDLTYRVVYTWTNGLLLNAVGNPQMAQWIMLLVVPFLWVIICLLATAWILGRRLARPLAELRLATERLKERDLDFTFTYDKKDEVGEVITGFAEMQRELKASLEREWRDQESRREMMAALAHDLRTPLTLILGHAETLLAAPPERRAERLERYLTAIAAGVHRTTILLDDLVLIATLQQSDFRLTPRSVALQPEMAAWVQEYRVLAEQQGARLTWSTTGTERVIAIDLTRIHQVMDNLITNALRYTRAGGEVSVALTWASDHVRVEVRDAGPGFAAADLPHLFDRLFQGGQGSVGAAGLGLYICRLLVEQHGGQIEAGNRPEGGGWVEFTLPVA